MSDKSRSTISRKTAMLDRRLALWVNVVTGESEWFSHEPGTLLARCTECHRRRTMIVFTDGLSLFLFCSFCVVNLADGRTVSQAGDGPRL